MCVQLPKNIKFILSLEQVITEIRGMQNMASKKRKVAFEKLMWNFCWNIFKIAKKGKTKYLAGRRGENQ